MITSSSPDLGALVLRLRAPCSMRIRQYMGRAVYQLGLSLISRTDASLAQRLHDYNGAKPFTASGLMRGDGALLGNVEYGEAVWVRFTGLSAAVVAALAAFQAAPDTTVEINHQHWPLERAVWDDSSWAGLTRYRTLIERHRPARPSAYVKLRFQSATTFHSSGVNVPLPLPSLVFGSLLTRWCEFTPHRLRDLPDDLLFAFMRYHILLSQHEVHSVLYQYKNGGKEVGFVGWAHFNLARQCDFLTRQEPELEAALRRNYIWLARMVGLLADFARFSGLGLKTANGMGMVI